MNSIRLAWLDYLRGFCALSIMIYHYTSWSFGLFPSETFLGKIGIYGVSIFYILSGLTLFHVYKNKLILTFSSVRDFFVKRFFRIYPLLWLVTILTLVLNRTVPIKDLILNLTGLFGFIRWDAYLATGAWSIGNELVFYVLFPFLLFFSRKWKFMLGIMAGSFFVVYVFFAFFVLDYEAWTAAQWTNYINPLNQAFLFVAGFLIGFLGSRLNSPINKYKLLIMNILGGGVMVISTLLFIFYPVTGETTHIITQWSRLAFTLLCCCICMCFYKISINLPLFLHYPLSKLGEASYSIYLVHPIVWSGMTFLSKHFVILSVWVEITISIVLTIIGSMVIYCFFEKKFIHLGNKITGEKSCFKIN